ncbi:MAG: hypothetical protein E4H40_08755 [Candidatus Brocadiia bacterium]|nr:MAG: hypothetical protein E4H40_08755 [Candidatus Brocadiia bacterium]
MKAVNNDRRTEIVTLLSGAVDSLADAVASGRLGFDYAVKEYVEQSDNELSRVLQEYVQALQLGDEPKRISSEDESRSREEVRRAILGKLARHFDVPEVTAFVDAVLESQDKRLSIVRTLDDQAAKLRQLLSTA